MKIQRNDPCPCNSGKKYKKCCIVNDEIEAKYLAATQTKSYSNKKFTFAVNPDLEEKCYAILERYESDKDRNIAIDKLLELHREYADNYIINYALGSCYAISKEFDSAQFFLENAVNINPICTQAFLNLGGVYTQLTRIGDATRCYKRALEISQKDSDYYTYAQTQLSNLENITQNVSKISLEEFIKSESYFDYAYKSLMKANYDTAIIFFNKVLLIEPNNAQSHCNLGVAYGIIGNKKLALEHLDKALEIDPSYESAICNRKNLIERNEKDSNYDSI